MEHTLILFLILYLLFPIIFKDFLVAFSLFKLFEHVFSGLFRQEILLGSTIGALRRLGLLTNMFIDKIILSLILKIWFAEFMRDLLDQFLLVAWVDLLLVPEFAGVMEVVLGAHEMLVPTILLNVFFHDPELLFLIILILVPLLLIDLPGLINLNPFHGLILVLHISQFLIKFFRLFLFVFYFQLELLLLFEVFVLF